MIFYFTGTGNSLYAADYLAEAQGDRLISIAALMDQQKDVYHYEMGANDLIGFVYPVFAWGPPKMVLDFIKKLEISGRPGESGNTEGSGKPYVFSLCTCGDEEGNTSKIMRKALSQKGLPLDGAFSLRMPNSYLIGFDVDPKSLETEKLKTAELLLSEINGTITKRQKNIELVLPGRFPVLKTSLVNPLFNAFALNTKHFHADNSCTHCGICENVCPVHTIRVTDTEKPVWGKACTQCLACINRCPAHAIQYGKGTSGKGRYHHPDIDRLEKRIEEQTDVDRTSQLLE